MGDSSETVLCLSHLRWRFVHQRPQHLLSRCARQNRVLYFEEPMFDAISPELEVVSCDHGVLVIVPHLPPGTSPHVAEAVQGRMLVDLLEELSAPNPIVWFYTPMALPIAARVDARATVYDCMDELSAFLGAPPELVERERRLLQRADVVFTGGHSLFEHKRQLHHNIHPFPSSVDVHHFAQARELMPDPEDQDGFPRPRIGFFGVIDERMDLGLIERLAEAEPLWQLVMLGPVAKVDPARLPRRPNIHWLGPKSYRELPGYLAGWDVAMLPFARNESTRFISPTKTPEYLAAAKPVVSTSIRDVVRPYGEQGLVWIADGVAEFAAAIREALASDRAVRVAQADAFLADLSWDRTWEEMWSHVERARKPRTQAPESDVPWAPPSAESAPIPAQEG